MRRSKWWLMEEVQGDGSPGEGAAPPPAAEEPIPGPSQDFSDFLSDDDGDISPVHSGDEGERLDTRGQPPSEPVPASSPSPQPSAAQPATPAPETPVAPATPAPPAAPAITPEQVAEFRKRYQEELEGMYQLPDTDAVAMTTEPERVLPKLAAQLHLRVMEQVMGQLQRDIPSMMHVMQQSRAVEDSAKQAFFGKWPGLAPYENEILRVGQMYRAANPKVVGEEAIERIGKMTAMALNVDEEVARGRKGQGTTPAPAAPATPQPRRPVGMGGGGSPVSATPTGNIFEQFADEAKSGVDDDF